MPDYAALKTEITNDPLTLGYAGKTDAQVAATMNATSRPTTVARTTVSTYEIFDAINPTEFGNLAAAEKQRIQIILGMGSVNLAGTNTQNALSAAFPAGTASRAAILALLTQSSPRSRAEEIFGYAVTAADINKARSL